MREKLVALLVVGLAATNAARSGDDLDSWTKFLDDFRHDYRGSPFAYIAHAGGGYEDSKFSNSLEALEASYLRGFRLFEIDFMYTSDTQIVCIHHWSHGPMTLAAFKEATNNPSDPVMKFTNCDIDSLASFMKNRADAILVTDTKEDNPTKITQAVVKGLEDRGIPRSRVIPQAYTLDETILYKNSGFERIIFTLYKIGHGRDNAKACALGGVAITFPWGWPQNNTPLHLPPGCLAFTHTVNEEPKIDFILSRIPQLSGIYTDFLSPSLKSRKF